MRALLVAVGTRGDVQPALALAFELRKLGHEARLSVSPNFVDWANRLGFEAVPMGVEMRMPSPKSGAMPTLTPEELRRLRDSMPDLITDQFETIGPAADGCDVIVGCNAHQYAGPSIGATTSHAAMTEESLTHALRDVLDPAVVQRARALAGQVGRDGAAVAAKRLVADHGS